MNIEGYERILSLQLDWVKSADAKVPPLFAINIAMLGVLAALVKPLNMWTIVSAIFAVLCAIPLLLSVGSLVLVMFPRLSGPKDSNIFFGGISKKEENQYLIRMEGISDDEYIKDILRQVYRNAEIAGAKYSYVKIAFIFSFISVPLWLIAICLLHQIEG